MSKSGNDLFEMAERVNSKASFIAFAEALAADRRAEVAAEAASPSSPYGPGARGWEHDSIEAFLEAMSAWAPGTSAETGQLFVPEEPSWRAFAEILHAGKFYE